MRGEYCHNKQDVICCYGSSPHAWRIFFSSAFGINAPRFIPTCVENISALPLASWASSVHPHMRGEYVMWMGPLECWLRFIPTCVENIQTAGRHCRRGSVHPHMRGEYSETSRANSARAGSSPHAWRIFSPIPYPLPLTSVHPHMRGEYTSPTMPASYDYGSSPHAWRI